MECTISSGHRIQILKPPCVIPDGGCGIGSFDYEFGFDMSDFWFHLSTYATETLTYHISHRGYIGGNISISKDIFSRPALNIH